MNILNFITIYDQIGFIVGELPSFTKNSITLQ
jgi:hypothetical protein